MHFTINTVREINRQIEDDLPGLIADAEAVYYREIDALCAQICAHDAYKIILLAGPSGSGKTTTAHILCEHLAASGRPVQVISLDDFYAEDDAVPRLPNGERDIESVHALDLDTVRKCFSELCLQGVSEMPIFDFVTKRRSEQTRRVSIENGGIVIVEGLHALNPHIYETLPSESLFRIYISVNDKIFFSDGSLTLSSRQMRLVRRISRDALYRGSSIESTMKMWTGVVAGEEKYLYCFKDTADYQFSTLIRYEPAVFRDFVLPMMRSVDPKTENYEYVMRTARALEKFRSVDPALVPRTSLLREFIAGNEA